jgi:lactam utilization protein B
VLYQVAAVAGVAAAEGVKLQHVSRMGRVQHGRARPRTVGRNRASRALTTGTTLTETSSPSVGSGTGDGAA